MAQASRPPQSGAQVVPLLREEAVPALELEGIAHRFGSRWVLRGCALQLRAGEAVALMGQNGVGKTTLLRIIATLLRPTRGEGRVLGHDLRHEPAAIRAHIGLLGYVPALYEDLTAAENLRFALRMRGERADAARIHDVLGEVGLAHHADGRVRGFSSGMRRRVALARILLQQPRLLLLDEPYASFDDAGIDLVNSLVRRVADAGGAVLLATHDLPRAAAVVNRLLRMERGLVLEQDWNADLARGQGAARPPLRPVEAAECR